MTPINRARVNFARLLAAVCLILPLASCLNVVENKSNLFQYGAITIRGFGGRTPALATANAVFFSAAAASIPDSRLTQNSCAFSSVDTTTPTSLGDLRAGSALTLLIGAGSSKLTIPMDFNLSNVSYVSGSTFTYKAGDSATVSIPGDAAGFPASSINVRLAEPVVPEDITMPVSNSGLSMPVRWNTGDSTSAIILSIKYANPSSSSFANEQVVCSLKDDGSEEIAASALVPFLSSPIAKRSVRILRWRTSVLQPGTRSVLHIVSTVDSAAVLK